MKKKILSVIKYFFFLAIGIGLFWLAIKDVNLADIIKEFKKANYSWIAFSMVFMLISHIMRAARWNQFLSTLDCKPKTLTTFYAVMIGYFVNLAVPRLGEVTRCGVISTHHKIPVNSVIGTVIAERVFDMICLAVIMLIVVLTQLDFLGSFLSENMIQPIVSKFSSGSNALLVIGGSLVLLILLTYLIFKNLKNKFENSKIYQKIKKIIAGFWDGIKTIKKIKNIKLFFFYSAMMWFMYAITLYVSFFAFKSISQLTFIDSLTLMVIGSIGIVAPTNGGIGAYQWCVQTALVSLYGVTTIYKITEIQAVSFANTVFFSQWFFIIIIGGISWILLLLSQKNNLKNEQNRLVTS